MVGSGLQSLDDLLQELRFGDNVVWQVDSLTDYTRFTKSFVDCSIQSGLKCIYIRFAAHPAILRPCAGLTIIEIDPSPGFDYFSAAIHRIIEENGRDVCYVFDNLSDLVNRWATDELLANFFQVTCPYLFELDTVTYFAVTRNRHSPGAIARIRDTTQILVDVYHAGGAYIHPLKVWDRYSSQMFLPHLLSGEDLTPVFRSGDAAAVSISTGKRTIRTNAGSIAPWDSVYNKLSQYRSAGVAGFEVKHEMNALRHELARMLLGNHPEFNKLVDKYMTVEDLLGIRDRLIGSGRIGGKAAGMLVARKVLLTEPGKTDFSSVLEEHDSFYIGSDVFFTFLVNNNLFRLRLQLSRSSQLTREDFSDVEQYFLNGQFPKEIMEQFKDMLDYFGQAPIIVRSSSLQEDSYGNAFAGKYRSEFCANQGSPEERLDAFLRAVKLVYASALNPDAMVYRRKRGLGEGDEQMAIIVQRVSGMPYRNYFFPPLAGVAFSRNLYAWTDRIDPKQGMIRLVFGLGTRAVNRVGGDYPRMIAVSHPELRPETGVKIARYSQRQVDLLNLDTNTFDTISLRETIEDFDYPNLELLVSMMKGDYLQDFLYSPDVSSRDLVLTFNRLIHNRRLVKVMSEVLTKLESAWGQPVDIEFTAIAETDGKIRVNILQCRPLRLPAAASYSTALPQNLAPGQVLFKSNRTLSGGIVSGIRYIVYVDPRRYAEMKSASLKSSIGRVVGKINEYLRENGETSVVIGPGRWGSNNLNLGVNVTYADIDNFKVMVEVGRLEAGHEPDSSYGTHFFQDLVEADIIYLPVFPEQPDAEFNTSFFDESENALSELLPSFSDFMDYVKVVDVPSVSQGKLARVVGDAQSRTAVCYIE